MDCLTVGQCHHAEDAGRGFAGIRNFAPEADATIRLLLATERGGDDRGAPSRVDVGDAWGVPAPQSIASSSYCRFTDDKRFVNFRS